MKHLHLKKNIVPTLLLPKKQLAHQESQRPADVTTQASTSPIPHQENQGPAVVMTCASTSQAQVLVMQVPGESASAAAIGPAQGPLRTCTGFAEMRSVGTQTTAERRSIATQANTTLRFRVSAKTQTDAPVEEAVPEEAEPDFETARTHEWLQQWLSPLCQRASGQPIVHQLE